MFPIFISFTKKSKMKLRKLQFNIYIDFGGSENGKDITRS